MVLPLNMLLLSLVRQIATAAGVMYLMLQKILSVILCQGMVTQIMDLQLPELI